jgi:hypothetical protein
MTELILEALPDIEAGKPVDMARVYLYAVRRKLLVKIFAGFVVSKETVLMELDNHQVQHQQRLVVYRQIQQNFYANPENLSEKELFRYLTLRSGIRFETEWLAWCGEAIAVLSHHSTNQVKPQ